ncbi:MAG: hypothetical protein R6U25_06795, partial [Alkalispirochaeta sp.]
RGDLGFHAAANAYSERLTAAMHSHEKVRGEIDLILDQEDSDEETAALVSSEEYGFLLASDEEDESDEDTAPEPSSDSAGP